MHLVGRFLPPKFFGSVKLLGKEMPFSSLNDPVDLARAQAALDAAWIEVEPTIPDALKDRERTTLAYIVAGLAATTLDEDELRRRAIATYRR